MVHLEEEVEEIKVKLEVGTLAEDQEEMVPQDL
jgi:hypothetical protein